MNTNRPLPSIRRGSFTKSGINSVIFLLATTSKRNTKTETHATFPFFSFSYLGLLENVRVRRAGFAYRQDYTRFLLRYKLLCKQTWPNYRGQDQDGVKLILQEYNLAQDVTYGKTKLFVQSPESLFKLEEARDKCLPKIVIFLQKIWRGVQARRIYKRMKAALKIGLYYRHCVRRGYVRKLCTAYK